METRGRAEMGNGAVWGEEHREEQGRSRDGEWGCVGGGAGEQQGEEWGGAGGGIGEMGRWGRRRGGGGGRSRGRNRGGAHNAPDSTWRLRVAWLANLFCVRSSLCRWCFHLGICLETASAPRGAFSPALPHATPSPPCLVEHSGPGHFPWRFWLFSPPKPLSSGQLLACACMCYTLNKHFRSHGKNK